jgi:hypothetical protein
MSIKFSQLPVATLPLDGDEILCLVQGGTSKQINAVDLAGVAADPTAEVGLEPVNGEASTFMRSDAAPPLSQAIEPVWTGGHEFQAPVLFTYQDDGDVAPVTITSDDPALERHDTDRDPNERRWKWALDSSDFPYMALRLVADDGAIQDTAIRIDRAGANVLGITMRSTNGPITLEGNELYVYVNGGNTSALGITDVGEWQIGPTSDPGLAGQVLVSNGPGAPPSWGNVLLAAVEQVFASAAGNNNNVALTAQRVLVDTAAGNATITGLGALANGTLILVTNTGVNDLVLAVENVGSVAANRLYGVADITIISHGSKFLSYSATLARWVLV